MSLLKSRGLLVVANKTARDLRSRSTGAEVLLWRQLRSRQLMGMKFRRQHPLFHDILGKETFYIADFYCHELKLVVEVDGGIHQKQRRLDKLRSSVLNDLGITVVRFKNEDVEHRMHRVLTVLKSKIESLSAEG